MRAPPPRIAYAVCFFLLLMALVIVARPAAVFDADGRARPFGAASAPTDMAADSPPPTMLSLGVVTLIAATLSLYVFTCIDAFFA